MNALIALFTNFWPVFAALGGVLAGWLTMLKVQSNAADKANLERDAQEAQEQAEVERAMAAVPATTDLRALARRLRERGVI